VSYIYPNIGGLRFEAFNFHFDVGMLRYISKL
jgi:hypothetical protein